MISEQRISIYSYLILITSLLILFSLVSIFDAASEKIDNNITGHSVSQSNVLNGIHFEKSYFLYYGFITLILFFIFIVTIKIKGKK